MATATFPDIAIAGIGTNGSGGAGGDGGQPRENMVNSPKGILEDAKAFGVVYGLANAAAIPTRQSYSQLTGQVMSGTANVVGKIFSWLKWKKLAALAGKVAGLVTNPVIAGTAINELLSLVLTGPLEKWKEKWLRDLAADLDELMAKVDGMSWKSLGDNEEFVTATI